MTNIKFKGIIPPTLTLFNKNGEIDEKCNRDYLEFLVDSGVHGLFMVGSNGFGPMMTVEQRKYLTEISLDQVKQRVPTIVHVGSPSCKISGELAKHAEKKGADAVASVPPYYYRHNEEEVINFYEHLIKSVEIPVFIYNNPNLSGFLVTPDIAVELAKRGVKGIKDSSFNIVAFYVMKEKMKILELDFQSIIGSDSLWLPSLLVDTKAVISAVANVFPKFMVDFYNKTLQEKKLQLLSELQMKVIRLRSILQTGELNVPRSLAALEMIGVNPGRPICPFKELDLTEKENIRNKLITERML